MNRYSFLTFIFLCLSLVGKAENTDLSQFENVLYVESQTCQAGESYTLSVKMKNSNSICGYQFDLVLPEGVTVAQDDESFYLISLSTERTTAKKTDYFNSAKQTDGSIRVLAASTQNITFSGNTGEVATIKINVASTVADGDYPVILKNIVTSDTDAKTYEVDNVESTLTIGKVTTTYDEGYSVQLLPFLFSEDAEVSFLASNATALKSVEFDVELPSAIVSGEAYYIDPSLAQTKYTTSDELSGNTVHVSVTGKKSNTIGIGENAAVATLGLAFADAALTAGVYSVTIKNIVMTDADDAEYHAAPYTTSIIVGQYTRSLQYEWGTVCLPYATESTSEVQLYTLLSVDTNNGIMKFVPAASVAANTPCIFKGALGSATFPVITADEATESVVNQETVVSGWTISGTYFDQTLSSSEKNIYYISENKFWYANEAFSVPAFRCWFEIPKTAGVNAKAFSIEDEDSTTTDIKYIENKEDSVDVVFDLAGRQLAGPQKGINIINGKKVIVK